MDNGQAQVDFDPETCLCQMKVVPKDKRVDFDELVRDVRTGKWKIVTKLRYHKDCPFHGVKVSYA